MVSATCTASGPDSSRKSARVRPAAACASRYRGYSGRVHHRAQAVAALAGSGEALRAERGQVDAGSGLLHGLGRHPDAREPEVLPLVAELVLGEALPDHLERLVGPPERLLRVEPEHRALTRHRPGADDQLQAPAGQDVHGGRVLGHPQRVVQREQQHVRPQPDHRRPGGRRGQQRELGRVVLVLGEVVLGQPPAAEPQLLTQHGLVEHLARVAPGCQPVRRTG